MRHPTNTRIVFADSEAEAREKYVALGIPTKDPEPVLECYKISELEDFEIDEEMNFVGEISVGPPVMKEIRQDPARAYVLYHMEDV
ncbi:MAG: hypothetical protein AB1815_06585 [Bacillota bacterium]